MKLLLKNGTQHRFFLKILELFKATFLNTAQDARPFWEKYKPPKNSESLTEKIYSHFHSLRQLLRYIEYHS